MVLGSVCNAKILGTCRKVRHHNKNPVGFYLINDSIRRTETEKIYKTSESKPDKQFRIHLATLVTSAFFLKKLPLRSNCSMRKYWWKIAAVVFIIYAIIGGFLMPAPDNLGIIQKSIRNLHFHVPMWFTMIIMLFTSYIYGILFLSKSEMKYDSLASSFVKAGMLFGLMGLATGSFWARFTWSTWWVEDAKLNGAAIGMMIYMAYYILRNSIEDDVKRGKFTAVYNLFAFPIFIVLIIVYPRMAETSLHPASGDTVGFSDLDLDNNLRKVFYIATLGWILLGTWIATLKYRVTELTRKDEEI